MIGGKYFVAVVTGGQDNTPSRRCEALEQIESLLVQPQ
jgi:hypothetical protein